MSPESAGAKVSRRVVSISIYATLCVLLWGLAPIWLPLAALFDLATSPRRLPRVRMLLFFAVYLALEVAGVAAAAVLSVSPGRRDPARFVAANAALQRWWTARLFAGACRTLGFTVRVEGGEALVLPAPFLLFVRHSSTADTILAAALIANPHHILLKYVLKRELLWDPCLDIVGQRLPNTFVDRTGSRREAEIAAVAALGRDLDIGSAALIFPEGSRFSPAKLALADARLRERPDLADWAGVFTHVLPPRLGGPLALLEAAPGVDVLVLEHAGFEPAASFAALWSGALVGTEVAVRVRRIPAADIPREGRERWLYELWRDTDRWVGERVA